MAKTAATAKPKKSKRRMKKQVRKTLGALFLASAIGVAAIPTGSIQGGQAEAAPVGATHGSRINPDSTWGSNVYNSDFSVTVDSAYNSTTNSGYIPVITNSDKIYVNEEMNLQFAYVTDKNNNSVAVLLGYSSLNLPGGVLSVPSTVDAFTQYTINEGTFGGFGAAGRNGNFLYYETDSPTTIEVVVPATVGVDSDGNPTYSYDFTDTVTNNPWFNADNPRLTSTLDLDSNHEAHDHSRFNNGTDTKYTHYYIDMTEDEETHARTYTYGVHDYSMQPCYVSTIDLWRNVDLFYTPINEQTLKTTSEELKAIGDFTPVNSEHERITNCAVAYLGNQYLQKETKTANLPDGSTSRYDVWSVVEESAGVPATTMNHPDHGIFAGNSNIRALTISNTLVGIGDYAFYGCNGLGGIDLSASNGLEVIGNSAFENCGQMTSVKIDVFSNLKEIGERAFYNCGNLQGFTVPIGTVKIGNQCFENCTAATEIDLGSTTGYGTAYEITVSTAKDDAGNDINVITTNPITTSSNRTTNSLQMVGIDAFKNCSSLSSIIIPTSMQRAMLLSSFEGCSALKYITTRNEIFDLVYKSGSSAAGGSGLSKDDYYTYDDFKATVPDEFYFEGKSTALVHERSKSDCFAFSYLDDNYKKTNLYEKTVQETGTDDEGKATYTAAPNGDDFSDGTLTGADLGSNVNSLTIPGHVGPVTVAHIGGTTFQNNTNIKKVNIPAQIVDIASGAFQGCNKINTVIFESGSTQIGAGAFRTQQGNVDVNGDRLPNTQLYFSAPITTENEISYPFEYAMSEGGAYSDSNYPVAYIKFYSGWPSNLTVEYNYNDDLGRRVAELTDFPTYADLDNYVKDYYADNGARGYLTDYLASLTESSATTADLLSEIYQAAPDTSTGNTFLASLSSNQQALVRAIRDVDVPYGIKSIKDGLLYEKEQNEKTNNSRPGYTLTLHGVSIINADSHEDIEDDATIPGTSTKKVEAYKGSDFQGLSNLKGVTLSGDADVPAYAFMDNSALSSITMDGNAESIGDYAFANCTNLGNEAADDTSVYIGSSVTSMGICPFKGDEKLANVALNDNNHFTCDNSIIYETTDGNKTSIVECLQGKQSTAVLATEVPATVTSIKPYAFEDTDVISVDLSNSGISKITENTFGETSNLTTLYLGSRTNTIEGDSFKNSGIQQLYIPKKDVTMRPGALDNRANDDANTKTLSVYTPQYLVAPIYDDDGNITNAADVEESNGYIYVQNNYVAENLRWETYPESNNFTVTFKIWDETLGHEYVPDNTYVLTFTKLASDASYPKLTSEDTPNPYGALDASSFVKNGENTTFQYWYETGSLFIKLRGDSAYQPTISYSDLIGSIEVSHDMEFTAVYATPDATSYVARFYDSDPATGEQKGLISGYENVAVITTTDSETGVTTGKVQYIPTLSNPDGYTWVGWTVLNPSGFEVTDETPTTITFTAKYTQNIANTHTVTFWGYDAETNTPNVKIAGTYTVEDGGSVPQATALAYAANVPKPDTTFKEWNKSYSNIFSDTHIYAVYNDGSGGGTSSDNSGSSSGGSGTTSGNNSGSGDSGNSSGSGSSSGNGSSSGSGSSGTTTSGNNSSSGSTTKATYYTLTVVNGSGSGSYIPGSQVIVVANDPASGKVFSSWTISPENTSIASKAVSATVVTMPSSNVTVTANYKAGSNSGNTSSSNNTTRTPGSTTTNRKGGTTVVIDKNGLSNTGVVSATVNGSSDNFTIKVSESSSAAEAAVRALTSAYGDISAIRYFPMDISLYDSTGQTKITDTSGLSITLTLPIPDSLVQYGGNNKVASTSNNYLENLGARFTTISGVPCITFTCEHFSPYVIYVDTNNLNASSMIDDTPKTADGIHPKWFLSAGLAAMSVVLFLKKDRKQKVKVKK